MREKVILHVPIFRCANFVGDGRRNRLFFCYMNL